MYSRNAWRTHNKNFGYKAKKHNQAFNVVNERLQRGPQLQCQTLNFCICCAVHQETGQTFSSSSDTRHSLGLKLHWNHKRFLLVRQIFFPAFVRLLCVLNPHLRHRLSNNVHIDTCIWHSRIERHRNGNAAADSKVKRSTWWSIQVLLFFSHTGSSESDLLFAFHENCGGGCYSLAPSCGAVLSNLLHLVQLRKQPLHTTFELWQTCQGFGRLQLPGVVQPALQHCGRGQRLVHGPTHKLVNCT